MQRSVRRSLVLLFVLLLLLLSAAVPGGLAEGDDPGDDHLSVTDPGDDPALQRKTKKSKRKKNQSGKNETERPKADARAKWDKSGDGSDGKDYWGMNNPNPGWDKYYAGKCDKFLECAAIGDLVCLEKDAIPLCNLQLQETQGDINVWAQGLGIAAKEGHLAVVQLLVKFATKWWNQDMIVNEAGETVLMHAAAHGQYEIVDWLIQQGADTRTLSPNGETAYDMARTSEAPGETLAAIERMAEMATNKLLDKLASGLALSKKDYVRIIKAGAYTNRVHNATGLTAIALGAKFGMAEMVKQLAGAGADVNWRDEEKTGHTVLHMACDRGHFGVVQTLLEEGADPSATTRHFEMDCLQLATMNGRNGIAQLMLDHGKAYPDRKADAKHKNFEGEDALLMFARQMYGRTAQQTGMVASLVDAGADINLRGHKGFTALYYLIDHAQDAAMQLLIEKGADVKDVARESGGEGEDGLEVELKVGAFEQSIRSGCRPCATWLIANGHREEFKFTKSRGGQEGMTGLYSVVMHNWMDVLAALIKDGADTNEGNRDNSTPLFAAAKSGNAEAVDILIKGGARVGHANKLGESALFIAAQSGKLNGIKALVKGGADVNQRSSDKTTALFRAAKNGHGRCVLELLRLGADKTVEGFSKTKVKGETGGQAGMASLTTAAQVAETSGYPDIAKVIREWQDIDKDL